MSERATRELGTGDLEEFERTGHAIFRSGNMAWWLGSRRLDQIDPVESDWSLAS